MPPEDKDRAVLWDMFEAADSIQMLVAGITFDEFQADRRTYRAVERELEIMGEAARNVSVALRTAHPEIPWMSIIGQRNVLIHEYGRVRYDLLWRTVVEDIPALIAALRPLVPAPPTEPDEE